jgi:predicted metal-binding protein
MDVIRPRKVSGEHLSEDALNQDLERYRQEAAKCKGISEAVIIGTEDIIVDIRVPLKCSIPKCYSYGTSIHCPPLIDTSAEEMKQVSKMYSHGILMKADLPPDLVAGKELTKAILSHDRDPQKKVVQLGRSVINIFQAVSKIESMAYYDGCYLSMGFAAGSCKETLCYKFPDCQAMEGKGCRHPNMARPSMEAVGFDAYRMAARVGWEIYPIGGNCVPESIPHGLMIGLVLIA